MGQDLRYQYRRDVQDYAGGSQAYEAGRLDREYHLDQRGPSQPWADRLRDDKGAIQNFTGGLAQLLAEKGIRANCVAPDRSGRR